METAITIFDIPEKDITVSKSKKQLEYEELEHNSSLNKQHFESFYDDELIEEEHAPPNTNMISILCKYIINYCTPIVSLLKSDKEYSITIQSDVPVLTHMTNGGQRIMAKDEQFDVVGLIVPKLFIRSYDKHMLSHFDHIPTNILSNSGQYGLYDDQTYKFTHQRKDILSQPGTPQLFENADTTSNNNNQIMFHDEDNALKLLKILMNHIAYENYYYSTNLPTLYYDFSSHPFSPDFENMGDAKWFIKRRDEDKQVLSFISEALPGKLGQNHDFDILFTLDKNKLTYAYYLGNAMGAANTLFKKAVNIRKLENKYYLTAKKNLYSSYEKILELSQKRKIAYDKYNDSNLDNMDTKQLKVIELEYQKIKKRHEKKISVRGKQIQKLFRSLKASFNDIESDRIQKNVRNIEKELETKELSSGQLLEGGECPHVYEYGKILLKNHGKPWLNTELKKHVVDKYSLPSDTSGFFCRICGEHLYDANNEGIARFIGGERVVFRYEEDPLQTLIWKEAMHIISTYVKFNNPIPLKPFVGSIASGLRSVIGEKEAKLIRSRTSTVDSIKDTLNLYSCIYVYATLSALMLTNPNKLIFGRDKPGDKPRQKTFDRKHSTNKPLKEEKKEDKLSTSKENSPKEVKKAKKESKGGAQTTSIFGESEYSSNYKQERRKARLKRRLSKIKHRYKGGKLSTNIKLYERQLLTTSLNLILFTKDAIIKRLKSFNVDVVKQVFLKEAYVWAKKYSKPFEVKKQKEEKGYKVFHDPVYKYIYYAQCLAFNNKLSSIKPKDMNDVKNILGRDNQQIKEDNYSLYDTVKIPKQWNFGDTLYDRYTYRSFLSIYKYASQNLHRKTVVPMNPQINKYYEEFADIKKDEAALDRLEAERNVQPLITIDWTNDIRSKYNDYSPDRINLTQHYCPNGDQHITGKYVFSDNNKTIEADKDEINKWLSDNDKQKLSQLNNMRLVNERCKLCNKLIRTGEQEKKGVTLSSMFKKIDDVLAFYQYYTTRCPKGDLHDIKDNICVKCKLDTSKENNKADEYYNRFVGEFKKIEREKQKLSIDSLKQAQKALGVKHKDNFNAPEYKYSLYKIAEWSKLSDVKYNTLVNLGLFEKYKFEEIDNGRKNPSKDIEQDVNNPDHKIRSMHIRNYIYKIIREYNSILHGSIDIHDIPLKLRDLLKTNKSDLQTIIKGMSKIKTNFNELDDEYKYTLSKSHYANFLLNVLCDLIIDMKKQKVLIKYFTNYIIDQEKIHSTAQSVFAKSKTDITTMENASDIEGNVSGEDFTGYYTDNKSDTDPEANEGYSNQIAAFEDAYDVENASDIWDNE